MSVSILVCHKVHSFFLIIEFQRIISVGETPDLLSQYPHTITPLKKIGTPLLAFKNRGSDRGAEEIYPTK